MVAKTIQLKLKSHLRHAGYARWFRAGMGFLLIVSLFVPTLSWVADIKSYALSPEVEKLLETPNKNLSAKFSFDAANNRWQFNKNGAASLASSITAKQGGKNTEGVAGALGQLMAKQIGGSGKQDNSLYSVDLSVKAKNGLTYYDNVTKLSFKMIPNFAARDGKMVQDRIVYPFSRGGQIIYTAKTDGLKEDIVLSKYLSDSITYGYTLDLPDTLEARLADDGSIGIYSANPALFGNISFGADSDEAKIMDARKNGVKNNLVFSIPPPYIKDQTGKAGHTRYQLDGKELSVIATGLQELKYPLTVDPSVTITSSSDFQNGNQEANADIGSGQVNRGGVTGGTFSAWHFTDNSVDRGVTQNAGSGAANGMIAARHSHATATYNGYIYALGGENNSGQINPGSVERAPINSNGTLGTWISSGNLPEQRTATVALAYNGYLYIVGGYTGGANFSADVKFAAINSSDGSLGTWTSTTSMPVGRTDHAAVVYNNMMYIINGCTTTAGSCNGTNPTATVYCASIYATGQVGAWNSTCGTTSLTGRDGFAAVAYNGYIYGVGGCATYSVFACTSEPTTVQYAKINTDGTLGSWRTTATSFTGSRGLANLVVHNGYLYLTGDVGTNYTNVVQYAPVYANGDVGTWVTGNSFVTARSNTALVSYNNYLYIVGGCSTFSTACGGTRNDVQYAQIDLAGVLDPYAAETDTIETDGLMHSATVAYNGFIYLLGGVNGTSLNNSVTTVYYAALNSDGSTGAWSTTSSFTAQRFGAAAVAYNGYMYLLGGQHTTSDTSCSPSAGLYCTDVQKAVINSNGTLGAWSSAGGDYSTLGRASLGTATYNGYIYAFGGVYNNNTNVSSETTVGQIQSNGNVTGWTTTGNLATGVEGLAVAQYGQYLFALAGRTAGVNFNTVVQYAVLNSSGTVTWASTNAFANGRANFMAGAYNGYVYIAGGIYGAGTNNYSDTQYARICQTTATTDGCNGTVGTLGTWHTTKSFTTTRGGLMGTIYNGYLYIAGGCTNWGILGACASSAALLNDLQYARVNNGGNGETGSWTNTGVGPGSSRAALASTTYNGYIYALGGCGAASSVNTCQNNTIRSTFSYASVNPNGTISSWNAEVNLPSSLGRFGLSAAAYNGYLYLSGGCSSTDGSQICTGFQNDVYYAQINSDGSLGSWQSGGTFATGRFGHSMVVNNGYAYITGGCSAMNAGGCTTFQNDILYAQLGSNGLPGSWSSAGTGFTTGRFYHSAVVNNNGLYIIGGCSAVSTMDCTTVKSDIQRIALNTSNGTLSGSWTNTTSLPQANYGSSVVVYNGYLYVVGGCGANSAGACSSYNTSVRFISLGSNGLGGVWSKANATFAPPPFLATVGVVNGYMVMVGGYATNGAAQGVSYTSPVGVMSRIGRYSKLITVNPTTDIAGVYYSGSLDGGSSVQYRVAPSTGVFGTATSATQGTGSEPTPLCGVGSIYYVQVLITMGDTTNAVFADDNISNVTDVTIYYRINATPPPNLRLNGGKWFYSNVQQPLDTCKG